MPLEDDGYRPLTEDELYEQHADILQEVTNGEIEDFEGSIAQSLIQGDSKIIAQNQEQALQQLYEASYLETAEGPFLDLKVREVGITRNQATPATGVQQFLRDSPALSEYTIKKGTAVSTANGEVTFETTEKGSLRPYALFDSSTLDSEWTGDTASFSTTTTYIDEGTHSLEAAATNGVKIWRTDVTVRNGDRFQSALRVGSDNIIGVLFGVEDSSNYFEAVVDAVNGSLELVQVDSGTATTIVSDSVTVPTDEWAYTEIDIDNTDEISVSLINSADNTLTRIDGQVAFTSGGVGIKSRDGSSTKHADTITKTATSLNVEATSGGENTNLGRERLIELPSPPTGVTDTTNPLPTGNPDFRDTSGNKLVIGTDREGDEDLRDRAIETGSRGGAATANAVTAALRDTDNVIHVSFEENDTLTEDADGHPPLSIEFIIFGGRKEDIGQTLHEKVGLTERLTSGQNGTSVSYTVTDDTLKEDETYEWSVPTIVELDITVDIVVDGTYEGDDATINALVNYVGGTTVDGGTVIGTGIGEDIRHDAIRDRLVGDELGIDGISNISIDADGDGTDDSTTDSNGLTVYDVASTEIADTDGQDGSVTLNVTQT